MPPEQIGLFTPIKQAPTGKPKRALEDLSVIFSALACG
jgi:hypothetical protein